MSAAASHRPVICARRHVISVGHYLAAHAGFAVLEAGGNAIDAGVAAGIGLGVLQSDLVSVAGVAPIILYHTESRNVFTISGLGVWPRLVTPDCFMREHGGRIPRGLLRTVVPAAPDACIEALLRWGTMGFGDVAAAAVFGMDPQAAVEAPRFATYSFPDSFEPHGIQPGRLLLEARLPHSLADKLAGLGHDVEWWPECTWKAGAVCMIDSDPRAGVHRAGADPRRSTYALGW
jgi:gamma-glutamyltranspeptidase